MSLMLRVEAMAGDAIEVTCRELIALASDLNVTVMCPFNGVELMACPGDDPEKLKSEFHRLLDHRPAMQIARGRR
jgi:hypothetical protein